MSRRATTAPGADPRCPTCHGEGFAVGREGERAVASSCTCRVTCPMCKDSGFVAASTDFRAPTSRCACHRLHARIRAFNQAEIPARHALSTMASFRDQSRAHTQVRMKITQFLRDFDPEGDNRGIIFYGDVGRGKTHLLTAMVRELVLRRGVRTRFIEFSHLLADLKSGFGQGRGSAELIEPLATIPVLAIDELGKGRNTEFEGTIVDELVSRRYNAALPILATTNYAPGPATGMSIANAAQPDKHPALVDRVGDRVYSRLREMCIFVPLAGTDFREQSRTHGRK